MDNIEIERLIDEANRARWEAYERQSEALHAVADARMAEVLVMGTLPARRTQERAP